MTSNGLFAVILAGGRGSRFWPRSRKRSSKQILNIVGNNTMIQDTVHRLKGLVPMDRILIMTNQLLHDEILYQVPEVPAANIISEPAARSTAPCIGLAAAMIRHRDPNAVMAVFAADHLIADIKAFQSDLKYAADIAADTGRLVTFGVTPVRPDTGFGYIHAGDVFQEKDENCARDVTRFVEKPDIDKATEFFNDPDYFINSGMFVWKTETILQAISEFLPEIHKGLLRIEKHIGTPLELKATGEIFPHLTSISIDYGVMEKAENVAMVPASFDWNDIGSWSSLYDVWPKDDDGNAAIGRKISIDTKNSLIYSPNKIVATIGLENIIIVETDDALLVCNRDNAQDVSKIVELCRKRKLEEYL